jgi:hypothetical protein
VSPLVIGRVAAELALTAAGAATAGGFTDASSPASS